MALLKGWRNHFDGLRWVKWWFGITEVGLSGWVLLVESGYDWFAHVSEKFATILDEFGRVDLIEEARKFMLA